MNDNVELYLQLQKLLATCVALLYCLSDILKDDINLEGKEVNHNDS